MSGYSEIKKKITLAQTLWSLDGLAMLSGASLAYATPNEGVLSISVTLGVLMLFSGLANILVYLADKNPLMGAHWTIADGLITALLSVFLIFNKVIHPVLIPFFFGVWELFSGVLKIVESIELKDYKIKGYKWFVVIGCIELFSGISAMIEPVDNLLGIHTVIAVIMLIQGFGLVFKISAYRYLIEKGRI